MALHQLIVEEGPVPSAGWDMRMKMGNEKDACHSEVKIDCFIMD
ncbi:uncharacterized protein G2W53_026987 [Senna tora]|uniref:Uncharacterized protein n=1 Tax=Senna tora TaxID=362788 RepID=A0A834TG23_9FABA|nr:uncharacterized protein G2W53_026987 [Senna tora]